MLTSLRKSVGAAGKAGAWRQVVAFALTPNEEVSKPPPDEDSTHLSAFRRVSKPLETIEY